MTTRNRKILTNHVTLEFALLNACILLGVFLIIPYTFQVAIDSADIYRILLIFNISWVAIIMYNGNSDSYLNYNFLKRSKYFILNVFLLVGLTYTAGKLVGIKYFEQPIILLPIFLFAIINLLFFQSFFRFIRLKSRDSFQTKALVISKKHEKQFVSDFTEKIKNSGYKVIGYIADASNINNTNNVNPIGSINDISRILEVNPVDEIFINLKSLNDEELKQAIETADYHGVRVNLIPNNSYFIANSAKANDLTELPVVKLRETPLDKLNNYVVKMMFDFVFASIALILLSPILIIIALLIVADGKGGVFYTPYRKGIGGKTFKCYKFRTMSVCDDPVAGTKSTVKNDPRITRIGKYLRKYDIDELPQFINVLKGDMSVVGPRPHRVFLQQDFRKVINDYMVRHYVKPGLTGWAQVNGWRGPTVNDEQKKQRIKHDIYYIENWNFWFDVKIIFLTIFSKKTRQNAF